MGDFRGVASKIDACNVAKNSRRQQINFETLGNGLSTRLPDDTFRGIMNFIKAAEIGTPIGHIQKALVSQYLYLVQMCIHTTRDNVDIKMRNIFGFQ